MALTACSGADEAPTDIPEAPPKVSSTAPGQSEEASGQDSAAEAEPSESQDSSTEAAPTGSPSSTQETDPAGGASEGAAGGTGSNSETQESGPAGSDEAETGPAGSSAAEPSETATSSEPAESGSAAAPVESSPAETSPADPLAAYDRIEFITPSHNVGCTIDDDGIVCSIDETAYPASMEPEGCGSSVELRTSKRPEWGCRSSALSHGRTNEGGAWVDDLPVGKVVTIRGDFYTELKYGQTVSFSGTTCTSKRTGIECERTASGHGFKLASKEYQLW
ncbi:hypothetical protein [Kytococcus sedentarius]|uniref:hypothetical protein n=1 Tax=Kytococcus sedentarius TaxID=1276 RepID=UPI00194E8083|nr:hypothetical protein [Kytococcus sedentarius]QRO86987.1 hypothetical protein I6J30_09105 [Kytococcus sedentarius]